MVEYRKATLDDIIADAKKYKRVADLKELAARVDEDGKRINFLNLKRAYYAKFYDELIPVATKRISMWDKIASL